MQLYVANPTKQIQVFAYRMLGEKGIFTQTIGIGQQVKLSKVFDTPQLEAVMDHHARYGFVRSDEVDRVKSQINGIFSVDRPVTAAKIAKAMMLNTNVLVIRGREARKQAAIATSNRIDTEIDELTRTARSDVGRLRELDLSIVEQEPEGGYRPGEEPVGEGILVTKESTEQRQQRRRQ